MPSTPTLNPELQAELFSVYQFYAALTRNLDPVQGLGGQLLWAAELDADGCRLVRAANIAGAASLSASADIPAQKHAIREGVVDFMVNSLDEALRILKNQIRKREAVAVGISAAPALIVQQMIDRGVLPDLLPPTVGDEISIAEFLAQGAKRIELQPLPSQSVFVAFAQPPADFEARALALLSEDDQATRRWLRLSPRYLGPQARRIRSLCCDQQIATQLANS